MPVVRPIVGRRVAALAMGAAALALAANTVLPWWPHDCPHHAAMAAATVPAEGLALAAASAGPHAGHGGPAATPAAAHHGHAGHGDGPGLSAPCFGAGGGHGDSEVPCTCDGRTPPVVHLPTAVVLLPTTASVLATLPREVGRRIHRAVTLPRRSFPPHSLPLAQAPPRTG